LKGDLFLFRFNDRSHSQDGGGAADRGPYADEADESRRRVQPPAELSLAQVATIGAGSLVIVLVTIVLALSLTQEGVHGSMPRAFVAIDKWVTLN